MKYLIVTIITFFTIFRGYSQDVIIYNNKFKKDTKILYINDKYIFFKSIDKSNPKIEKVLKKRIKQIVFGNKQNKFKSKPQRPDSTLLTKNIKTKSKKITKTKSVNSPKNIVKNRIGLGADILLKNDNNHLVGISLDFYINPIINIGIGYGYFYGSPKTYLTTKVIIKSKKRDWSPLLSLYYTSFDYATILKTDLKTLKKEKSYPVFIPSLGYQYKNENGFTFDALLGSSLVKTLNRLHFNGVVFTLRVAGHI